jgi:hypothetical protein
MKFKAGDRIRYHRIIEDSYFYGQVTMVFDDGTIVVRWDNDGVARQYRPDDYDNNRWETVLNGLDQVLSDLTSSLDRSRSE